jgi:hypothetical protein
MNKIDNWDKIDDASEFQTLTVGPQICKIINVNDFPDKEYMCVEFDISEGELKGYYEELHKAFPAGRWKGFIYRSYKQTAAKFFKAFITAVEKSNPGFKWDWDENKLVGKTVVVNFREEEYINKQNEKAVIIRGFEFRSLEALKNGEIKIAPRLCLSDDASPAPAPAAAVKPAVEDKDLPF